MTEGTGSKKKSWWKLGSQDTRLDELEALIEKQTAELMILREQQAEQEEVHKQTSSEKAKLQRRVTMQEESLKKLRANIRKLNHEKQNVDAHSTDLIEKLDELAEQSGTLLQQRNEARESHEEVQVQFENFLKQHSVIEEENFTLKAELKEAIKKSEDSVLEQTKIKEALTETTEVLRQKNKENRELKAQIEQLNSSLRESQEENSRFEQGGSQRSQLLEWFWFVSTQASLKISVKAASLAFAQVWEQFLPQWLEVFQGDNENRSIEERLEGLAKLLKDTGLCTLSWQLEEERYTFQLQDLFPDSSTLPASQEEQFSSPIPTLLLSLLHQTTSKEFRIESITRQDSNLQIEMVRKQPTELF